MKTRIGRRTLVAALFASLTVGVREVRASNAVDDCENFVMTACAIGGDSFCSFCCQQDNPLNEGGVCSNGPGQACLCF